MRRNPDAPDTAVVIALTKGYQAVIDSVDGDLATFKWQSNTTRQHGNTYASRKVSHRHLYLHRVILSRILGRSLLPKELVDHVDLDTLNNCRSNLRLATFAQNSCNSKPRSDNTSGYKGVVWDKAKERWRAQIHCDGKCIFLGYFDVPETAYVAYCDSALKYQGEFARTGSG